MTSFCTLLPDPRSHIHWIRCHHGSCVVTVVIATPALPHLPILIRAPSPRASPPSLPLSPALCVYKAYPYMARRFREQLFGGRCCKQRSERLCQHGRVKAHSVSSYKHHCSRLQSHTRAERHNIMPSGQFFRNLAMKKPIVSLSALPGRGAVASVWSQISSGLNLWRRRSCSGGRPAPNMPSAPMWGSWQGRGEEQREVEVSFTALGVFVSPCTSVQPCYLWLKREAGEGSEGPGDLLLILC